MTQTRKWGLLTAVAVVASLALGWFLLISPKRGQAAELRSQAEQQAAANSQLQTRVAQLKAQSKDLPRQQARLEDIQARMPASPDLPALTRSLVDAAAQSGVVVMTLTPQAPAFVETKPAAAIAPKADAKAAAAGPQLKVAQIPLSVVVEGDYYEVEQFLGKLEKFKRSMLVTGLDLAAPSAAATSAEGARASQGAVTATIAGRVYMTVETKAVAPLKPAATGTSK